MKSIDSLTFKLQIPVKIEIIAPIPLLFKLQQEVLKVNNI